MQKSRFQSTLPARGATTRKQAEKANGSISIHAPRTGSDKHFHAKVGKCQYFNPRSPHGERRGKCVISIQPAQISIHAPRTGSDVKQEQRQYPGAISIHAPRTGSDYIADRILSNMRHFNPRSPHGERRSISLPSASYLINFNPRSPHGERQHTRQVLAVSTVISIHAPRTGSDDKASINSRLSDLISIHAPRTGSDVRFLFRPHHT